MKIKTSELADIKLDWAVATALGLKPTVYVYPSLPGHPRAEVNGSWFTPSTSWAQGGPIIERECISIEYGRGEWLELWLAYKLGSPDEDNPQNAKTPLIAAMRCYVASKLGDEVEIPEELV